MNYKSLNSALIVLIIVLSLTIYWFIPVSDTRFYFQQDQNTNFSINNSENTSLQFYENMRFPEKRISYKIENCTLQRSNDMEWAFGIIQEKTVLEFYPVLKDEQITVTCNDDIRYEEKLFIVGEGGPTNITVSGDFNIIETGKVLLMKDSTCQRPNIAIHELLHVLGFKHSENPKNIMYEVSSCKQEIGEEITQFINEIYSIPSVPDLLFKDSSVKTHGRYLAVNFSVRNNGLKDSEKFVVKIVANGKDVKTFNMGPIKFGYGERVFLSNIFVNQIDIKNVELIIESDFKELDKDNNHAIFEIKK